MTAQISKKLNWLQRNLPEGLLVDARWLERHGYHSSLRSQYVSAGWLEQAARGVFRRPRGTVSWEQAVISLQTLLGYPVSVGGRTALELQGYTHYLSLSPSAIHLYSDQKIPAWLSKLPIDQRFIVHNRSRLLLIPNGSPGALSLMEEPVAEDETFVDAALRVITWGQWKWPMVVSTPERAYLELLNELPLHETFHMADVIMEGLANLSPRRMQSLLERVQSVKIKRLFFFFADRHSHSWLPRISREKIDLGRGKRALVKGGKFDTTYQITVPEEFTEVGSYGL